MVLKLYPVPHIDTVQSDETRYTYALVEIGTGKYLTKGKFDISSNMNEVELRHLTEKEADMWALEINDISSDNDNADSRACVRPNFYEFEYTKIN